MHATIKIRPSERRQRVHSSSLPSPLAAAAACAFPPSRPVPRRLYPPVLPLGVVRHGLIRHDLLGQVPPPLPIRQSARVILGTALDDCSRLQQHHFTTVACVRALVEFLGIEVRAIACHAMVRFQLLCHGRGDHAEPSGIGGAVVAASTPRKVVRIIVVDDEEEEEAAAITMQ